MKIEFELSIADAANAIGVSESTIRRLAMAGKLPYRLKGFGPKRRKMFFRSKDCAAKRRELLEGVEAVHC